MTAVVLTKTMARINFELMRDGVGILLLSATRGRGRVDSLPTYECVFRYGSQRALHKDSRGIKRTYGWNTLNQE